MAENYPMKDNDRLRIAPDLLALERGEDEFLLANGLDLRPLYVKSGIRYSRPRARQAGERLGNDSLLKGDAMKKKRGKKPRTRPCAEEPSPGRFAKTCSRAAIIAASYQIFSLGAGTLIDHNPQLLVRREDDKKTVIERVATSISSTLEEPVYGWCTCAHLGQRGPGGGGGSGGGWTGGSAGGGNAANSGGAAVQQGQGQAGDQNDAAQQAIADEKNREAERRQAKDFEERKQRALSEFKGLDDADGIGVGPKGTAGDGLKAVDDGDASVVDLTHLDPNKKIVVDPNVAKGRERMFAVQVSEKTLNNENYMKGFDAIRAGNYALAVEYFKKAQAELPGDVLVRNGRDLAQDLDRVHKQEAVKKAAAPAQTEANQGLRAAAGGDYEAAAAHYESAAKQNPRYRDDATFARDVKAAKAAGEAGAASPDRKPRVEKSGKLIDNAFAAWQKRDYNTSIALLQAALSADPDNRKIRDAIDFVKSAKSRSMKPQATAGK